MKKCIFTALFLLFSIMAFSETIFLKDGTILNGIIKDQNETQITIETSIGDIVVDKSKIEKIEYSSEAKNDQDNPSRTYAKKSAFMWRPLPTIVTGILGGADFVFEGQTAFSKMFAINAIVEIGSIDGIMITALNVGPQLNLTGKYLDGLYLGIYPGYLYATDYIDQMYLFTTEFEAGYQGVFKNGISWGAYAGYALSLSSSFKFGLKIGYSFPDFLVKIEEK